VDVLVEVEGREDQDPRLLVCGEDALRRLEPIQIGHPDVHEHDVRMEARRLLDRLEPVARLGHDLHVLLARKQHAKARPHHRLVVGHEHADAHSLYPSVGRRALRTKPPSGAAPAFISPP
jgi:hypothetical protein